MHDRPPHREVGGAREWVGREVFVERLGGNRRRAAIIRFWTPGGATAMRRGFQRGWALKGPGRGWVVSRGGGGVRRGGR